MRQNTTIEQPTILATVFLPLTFVTGFFGQNFGWLVGHIEPDADFAAFGIGGLGCRWCCCSGGCGCAGRARAGLLSRLRADVRFPAAARPPRPDCYLVFVNVT